jgi:phosphate:Na+ symporter
MVPWGVAFTIVPGLILFLYGIENFSKEILSVAKGKFNQALGKLTTNPIKGALLGAVVTALVQSSTATTVITVGLVNAGILSFVQSLGIIIGSNIGTTVTAQLVAFKLTSFGPAFILLGFAIGYIGKQYRFLGKPIFYFGLVFFSLSLLSGALEPFRNDPQIISFIAQYSQFPFALLVGFAITVIFHSSAITTGIVVLLAQTGFVTLPQGILLLLGANIGTTVTSLYASARMGLFARRAAIAHFFFNTGGALIILSVFGVFVSAISFIGGSEAQQVANAHLLFNIIIAVIFLIFIRQFKSAVERVVPGEEKEILLKPKYLKEELPDDTPLCFELIEMELKYLYETTHEMLSEGIKLLGDGRDAAQTLIKLKTLNEILDERIEQALYSVSKRKLDEIEAQKTVIFVRMSNLLFRLGYWGKDLGDAISNVRDRGAILSPEQKREIHEAYTTLDKNISALHSDFPKISADTIKEIKRNDNEMREKLNIFYQAHLSRISQESEEADSIIVELLTIIEAGNGNIHILRKLADMNSKLEEQGIISTVFETEE